MINVFIQYFGATNPPCTGGSFLLFPPWYAYLPGITSKINGTTTCTPSIQNLSDIWLIVAAVIEILLRIAALAAVVGVISGGFTYLTSQGEAEKTAKAKSTIVSAIIGLIVSVSAATIITFIAESIK